MAVGVHISFRKLASGLALLGILALPACAPAPMAQGISDPHEVANRRTQQANAKFDQVFFGPVSNAYGSGLPESLRNRVSDFSANTGLPSLIVNDLLQGKIEDAAHNTVRLLFNATIGLAGLFDPATDIGLEERSTDFGETLHVWGFSEGDYVVLPFFGPSNERDMFGVLVDFFTNPLSYTLPRPQSFIPTGANLISRFGDRYTYADTFDMVLYEGEDPYATARLYYLDSRRYDLGEDATNEELYDIYEEAYD